VTGPRPPADLAKQRPRVLTLKSGQLLHRFYTAAFDPIFYDRSLDGRLNAPDGAYGVLYAAQERAGAFAETFLRTPGRRMLDPALQARKGFVRLRVLQPLKLIHLDGPGLARVGATAEVVHSGLPYGLPQAWSAAIHALPFDGIAYSARHDPHETCYAIFERARDRLKEFDRTGDLDVDWFWRLAETYDVGRAP